MRPELKYEYSEKELNFTKCDKELNSQIGKWIKICEKICSRLSNRIKHKVIKYNKRHHDWYGNCQYRIKKLMKNWTECAGIRKDASETYLYLDRR